MLRKLEKVGRIDIADIRYAFMAIMPVACLAAAFWLCGLLF